MEGFSDLAPADKLEAILAASFRPCPRDVLLEMAEIDFDVLDESTKLQVNEVFERWAAVNDGESRELYSVPIEQKDAVMNRIAVDRNSVYGQIAKLGARMFGIE